MAHHGVYPHDIVPPKSKYFDSGRFGRIFGKLPAFSADTPEMRAALLDIGKPKGIMDAEDKLSEGPINLITTRRCRSTIQTIRTLPRASPFSASSSITT